MDSSVDSSVDPSVAPAPGEPGTTEAERVRALRRELDRLGDSVVVVGGNGLWQVHVHVNDIDGIGAAVEAGLAAGRPHRLRLAALSNGREPGPASVVVIAVVEGDGLIALLTDAGAVVVDAGHMSDLEPAVAAAADRAGGALVAIAPGDPDALAAAQRLPAVLGSRVRLIRSRSVVQVIAALAVHDPGREGERDLLEMATAAASCRHGLVEIAQGEGVTTAGRCRAGDVLGHVDGDVALIGSNAAEVAGQVVDRLLGGGGELVTLVSGRDAASDLVTAVSAGIRSRRPDVDVTAYVGGQPRSLLLVGVE